MSDPQKKDVERYAVMHCHFYQPPRENPWIEEIERQEGAEPFHDWNEFITHQCYMPNMASRVLRNNKIVDLVNNYSYVSFNFGPTLIGWLEKQYPHLYEGILEADRISMTRNNGHGNAIAQVYNHVIMPLENSRDKHTQVAWGIRDFEHRFRRKPEAMWLSETACNIETLEVLIDHGMKFVILSPSQAEKVKPVSGDKWADVSGGNVDVRKPYRHFMHDKDGKRIESRSIDVFFYDGPVSKGLAFASITNSSAACADAFVEAYGRCDCTPALVSAAVDGETFGHHHQFTDMCLADSLKYEMPDRKIKVVNYACYLELCPPKDEVIIKQGVNGEGTSCSCAHGMGRWKENCGCFTGQAGFHQKWRAPFRQALRNLRDALIPVYESQGGKIFHDPWKARDEYVDLILDRSEQNVMRWLGEHMKVGVTAESRSLAIQLLEMQRHAMLMFTSCGWFFDELSRIETMQCMLYAARAAQLCRAVSGHDYEQKLKDELAAAPSNIAEFGNGRKIYERFVEPARADWKKIIAQYAIRLALLPDHPTPNRIYSFILEGSALEWNSSDHWAYGVGFVRFFSSVTFERHEGSYFCIHLGGTDVRCFVRDFQGEDDLARMRQRIMELAPNIIEIGLRSIAQEFFTDPAYTLDDLFRDDREKVISSFMKEKIESWKSYFKQVFRDNIALMKRYKELGWTIPAELKIPSLYAQAVELAEKLRESSVDWNLDRVRGMKPSLDLCRRLGLDLNLHDAENLLLRLIMAKITALRQNLNLHDAGILNELLDVAANLQIRYPPYRAENEMFRLLNDVVKGIIAHTEEAGQTAQAVDAIVKAAEKMNFDVEMLLKAAGKPEGEKGR